MHERYLQWDIGILEKGNEYHAGDEAANVSTERHSATFGAGSE